MDKRYTLNDTLFKYSLAKSSESEEAFEGKGRIMVVGGVATQLISYNKDLLRPTTDIDLIIDKSVSKTERRKWAECLGQKIEKEGYPVNYGLNRYGAEVNFANLERNLVIHLNYLGSGFFERFRKKIEREYERAEIYNILDTKIRCQSPMDIIINKLRRIEILDKFNKIELDSYKKYFLSLVKDAQFDDIDTEELSDMLVENIIDRNQTIEDISRESFDLVKKRIDQYKIYKDIYDISLIIESCRKKNMEIPSKTFRKDLKDALRE